MIDGSPNNPYPTANPTVDTILLYPTGNARPRFGISLVASVVILALLAAAPAVAQTGRVAGVSVTVTDVRRGAGVNQDADLEIQVTTVPPPSPTYPLPGIGFLGDYLYTNTYATTPTSPFPFTTVPLLVPISSSPPTFVYNYLLLYGAYIQQATARYQLYYDGALPAIDYGDGNTLPAATLPYSPALSGGGTRVFRGSFTHSYATAGNYTVRVASAPYPASTVLTGTTAPATTYPWFGSFRLLLDGIFSFTSARLSTIIVETSPTFTVSTIGPTYLPSGTITIASALIYPYFVFSTTVTTGPAQLVNSALVRALDVTEVPAASTTGLVVLAITLALAGGWLLRR